MKALPVGMMEMNITVGTDAYQRLSEAKYHRKLTESYEREMK
jgi:hypothetical protein